MFLRHVIDAQSYNIDAIHSMWTLGLPPDIEQKNDRELENRVVIPMFNGFNMLVNHLLPNTD